MAGSFFVLYCNGLCREPTQPRGTSEHLNISLTPRPTPPQLHLLLHPNFDVLHLISYGSRSFRWSIGGVVRSWAFSRFQSVITGSVAECWARRRVNPLVPSAVSKVPACRIFFQHIAQARRNMYILRRIAAVLVSTCLLSSSYGRTCS